MDTPELMTVGDFLRLYRIGRTTFYREVEAGRLKIVKVGRATRVTRLDAANWLASLRQQPDSPVPAYADGERK